MMRPFLRRVWRSGRSYYGANLAVNGALAAIIALSAAFLIPLIRPENLRGIPPGMSPQLAYERAVAVVVLTLSLASSIGASATAAMVAGGSIQADIRNGVYEVLLGNGVELAQIARGLLAASLSAAAALYLAALAAIGAVVALEAPAAMPVMPAAALAMLASVVSGAVLIVFIGLTKPELFKMATGVGATKNLAYTISLAPGVALLFSMLPFFGSLDLGGAVAVAVALSSAALALSAVLAVATPRVANREKLVSQAE